MTQPPQHRGRVVWRLALGLLLAMGLLGMSQRSTSAAPSHIAHATHAMNVNESDYGRWHVSVEVSNCIWGEGSLNCNVNGHCWVDGLGKWVQFDTKYQINCTIFRKPSNSGWIAVWWSSAVYTQGVFDWPPTGRVAGVDFPTFTGVGGDTWEVDVTYGTVCSEYAGLCVQRTQEWDDAPPPNGGLNIQNWV
jgi:hypothetical protein